MITFLLITGFYCLGVMSAIVVLAWVNAKYDVNMIPELSLLSWIIVLWIIFVIATSPLGKLYQRLYNKFKNKNKKEGKL